ncbi:MAG TPA: hypothetical protein VG963_25345, partial [Polyangiaceae bacterium]|nr:hypothetical protein [Polyangiaceae bacterium]
SFHDRVSGPLAPSLEEPIAAEQRWSDRELLEQAYYGAEGEIGGALLDHGTEGFFPERLPHLYLRWELAPGSFHLIEAVASEHELSE